MLEPTFQRMLYFQVTKNNDFDRMSKYTKLWRLKLLTQDYFFPNLTILIKLCVHKLDQISNTFE